MEGKIVSKGYIFKLVIIWVIGILFYGEMTRIGII